MPNDERAPSFQFYPRDWMADPAIQCLDWAERGRYHWALCASAQTPTPGIADEGQWRRWMGYSIAEWPDHRDAHGRCFRIKPDGMWVQRRMVADRKAQENRYENSRKGVAVTNAKRWGSVASDAKASRDGVSPASASASAFSSALDSKASNPTPLSAGADGSNGVPADFKAWYDAFPRKIDPKDALKAWRQMLRTGATVERIIAGTQPWLLFWNLENTEAKFIKAPGPWLRAERYLQTPPASNGHASEVGMPWLGKYNPDGSLKETAT